MNPILNHTRVTASGHTPERWMLVLHGIYGSGRNWGTIARRLVDARPEWGALLVDLRMHGGSQGFAPPHTVAAAAADVDALVEHLDFHAAVVLGHSFGGKVALMYARDHGDELRQAWVMDSTPAVREPEGSAWRMLEAVRSLPAEFGARSDAVEGLVERGYPEALAQWMAINLEPADGRYRWRLDLDAVEEISPILLFGVDAPAVMPSSKGPAGASPPPRPRRRRGVPFGLWRMLPLSGSMQPRPRRGTWRVLPAHSTARWLVFDEL
jgi:esterase